MPGFKDFVTLTALAESDLDDYLAKQVNMKFASAAARTAALTGFFREGIHSYLDDLNTIGINTGATDVHSTIGPVHGALTTFVPTLTQGATPTKTVSYASYTRLGRMIIGNVTLAVTSAGTAANAVIVGLPVAAVAGLPGLLTLGTMNIFDASVGTYYTGALNWVSTITANAVGGGGVTGYLGAVQFTAALASGDYVTYSFHYEAGADG